MEQQVSITTVKEDVMGSRLRLRGPALLRIGKGAENAHQLSLQSRKSYGSVASYTKENNPVKYIDLGVLTAILVDGLGLTPEEVLQLKLADLFEYAEVVD